MEGPGFLLPDKVEDKLHRNNKFRQFVINKYNWYYILDLYFT